MAVQKVSPLISIFAFVALPVIGMDQATKFWALQALELNGEKQPILGNWLGLQLIRNPGAAFSIASEHTWIFSVIAVIVILIIGYAGRKMTAKTWQLALGLLAGGAIGNLIDRVIQPPGIFQGHVVDFLNYHSLFVGNVADIAIVVGVLLVVVLIVMGIPSAKRPRSRHRSR